MIVCQLEIVNKLGLHARAATRLAATAGQFNCSIQAGHNGKLVDAKSVMSLMLLAASRGTVLDFTFDGPDEQVAHQAVCALLTDRFSEPE